MTQRYSSADQERYFQPNKIHVIRDRQGRGSSWSKYYIYQINMVTGRWVSVLLKDSSLNVWLKKKDRTSRSHWDYWWAETKKEAIDKAKERAILDNLPFDLQAGFLDSSDISESYTGGPITVCGLCGENQKRSWQPFICKTCLVDAEQGRKIRADDSSKIFIRVESLISVGRETSKEITEQLLLVARASWEEGVRAWAEKDPKYLGENKSYHSRDANIWQVALSEEQVEAIKKITEIINSLALYQYQKGKDYGSNLLLRLARGEVHPADFEDHRHPGGKD